MSRHFRVVIGCCPSEEEKVWRVEGDTLESCDGAGSYSFDAILRESGGGEELQSKTVSPLVSSALGDGHDLFIVAYGLPGTGKTHAVFGPSAQIARLRREARGLVARVGQQIFDLVSRDRVCRVSASFFHVFEDGRVTDLFDSRRRRLEVAENTPDTLSYTVPSLSVHQVSSSLELARLTERANLMRNASGGRRAPSPNPQSYKSHCSHAFVSLVVERVVGGGGEERVTKSHITVVDLAGHAIELVQAHQPSPDSGIQTLHKIMSILPSQGISAAADQFSRSPLTQLIKPCLGGSSEALLLGTVSLSEGSHEKTKICLKVLQEACQIKNYCRHSVTPINESDLGETLERVADMKKEVCRKVGLSEGPHSSWRRGKEENMEYVVINGQKFSQLSSSCINFLQELDKLEASLLYKGVSRTRQQTPLPMPNKPPTVSTPATKVPALSRPFLSKPAQLAKPISPPSVSTSMRQPSATHSSSSSSLEDSSLSDEDVLSLPSTTVSGPAPPPLRDIPHVIPNSMFAPPRPPPRNVAFRPSSGSSHPHPSLASSSQVSSVVSEAHTHPSHHPSSPTGSSSHSSSLRNTPIISSLPPTPHSTSSPLPRAHLPPPHIVPPLPAVKLAPLPKPVLPHTLTPNRPLLPPVLRAHPRLPSPQTPLHTSTPKKLNTLSVPLSGLPLSALPSIPPSPSQPSTPGSLTPNAGSPAPSPSPSPIPLHREPIIPSSHLPTSPVSPGPIARGNLSTSSSSISLTDSDLSQEAHDTFDPVMRSRVLSMHRNSLPYNGLPVTAGVYQPPQEEAPPYENVNHSFDRGQVGGEGSGGGERLNTNEYTSREEIHMAAMEGVKSSQLKKLAIQYGVDYRDHGGRTPLMYAVLGNQPRMCDILLHLGAKVNTQDGTGLTPLLWATFQAKPQCMKILLKHGADICMRDSEGRSVFHWAVKTPNINCLKILQRQATPTIINTADKEGLTPLHWAVLCNQPIHTHLLLTSCSADISIQDSEGRTALTHAVLSSSSACIKAILEVSEGAINQRDQKGRTALHYACAEGSTDCVRTLISARSCDLHSRDSRGTTPLHWAAAANQPSVLQLLLRRGVDRSLEDCDGLTAVDHAEIRGHSECAHILHNYGLRRPSSALSLASQVSVHAQPQPPSLDQHGHVALSLPHRRFSLSHSSLPRPPADGQDHPDNDDTLSTHTQVRAEPRTHHQETTGGVRWWRHALCGCSRGRRNAVAPVTDVT